MNNTNNNVIGIFGNTHDRERTVVVAKSVFLASPLHSHHVTNKFGALLAVARIEWSGASLAALVKELSHRMPGVMFDLRLQVLPGTQIATRRLVIMDGLVVEDVEPVDPLTYVQNSFEVPYEDGELIFLNPQRNIEVVLHDDYSVDYVGTVIATMDLLYSFVHGNIASGLQWKEMWDWRKTLDVMGALDSLLTAEESTRVEQHWEQHERNVTELLASLEGPKGLRGAG